MRKDERRPEMSETMRVSNTKLLKCVAVGAVILSGACTQQISAPAGPAPVTEPRERLKLLALPPQRQVPKDVTNKYADNPAAAALGKKFFFDTRFSGPLLDDANDGSGGTLGQQGQVGKVACASCHNPESKAFVDVRSPREQLSLGSGWTRRHAPSLLDVAEATFLTWDGRRDTAYSQVFAPLESAREFNSSRLYVAQQIIRLYKAEYEAVFGPLPVLNYPALPAGNAGCTDLPADYSTHDTCSVPGQQDEVVTRIVTNFGKAIQAYTRTLTCGRSRFDDWIDGDASALTVDEQAGALLFVTKGGCDQCHSGPYMTDQKFHNIGVPGDLIPFTDVNTANDPGAAEALAEVRKDWLNSKGRFSDGDDHRLDGLPGNLSGLLGAFRTPSLRCVTRHLTFMHNGVFRSIQDVMRFFSKGGTETNFVGTSVNYARNFTDQEQAQMIAFLRALDGDGPDPAALEPPTLP